MHSGLAAVGWGGRAQKEGERWGMALVVYVQEQCQGMAAPQEA